MLSDHSQTKLNSEEYNEAFNNKMIYNQYYLKDIQSNSGILGKQIKFIWIDPNIEIIEPQYVDFFEIDFNKNVTKNECVEMLNSLIANFGRDRYLRGFWSDIDELNYYNEKKVTREWYPSKLNSSKLFLDISKSMKGKICCEAPFNFNPFNTT